MKHREEAIDILKFFAALLITNSHLEAFEPAYRFATGGAIGDVLFLFCSGFSLFMGQMGRFDNWYKRRLSRIYPPVICWGILAAFCFGFNDSIRYMMIEGGGWFVQCILIYYLLAYPIRRYASGRLSIIFTVVLIVSCLWFLVWTDNKESSLYGWNYCKWALFFLFFLQGAKMGLDRVKAPCKHYASFALPLAGLLMCVVLWYAILYSVSHFSLPGGLQLLSVIPLLGIPYFFYALSNCSLMQKIYHSRIVYPVARSIGGLCFEIYLVQYTLFKANLIPASYPLNIAIIWLLIFAWAYALHVAVNFFMQTLRQGDYDWKSMLKIY